MLIRTLCAGTIFCVAGVLASADERSAKPNFTGTWNWAPTKSLFQTRGPDSSVVTIWHDDPGWKSERTHVSGGEPNHRLTERTTDGIPTTTKVGLTEIVSTLAWDGDSLVLRFSESRNGELISDGEVRYSLSDDGQTLTADERATNEIGTYRDIWVFVREGS
jgi:hypothetical protein